MKVRIVLLIALLLLPIAGRAAEKVTLQLRWDHQFQFAGYYAAKWRGYYADAGFDVEIRPAVLPDGTILKAVEEVAEGRADFGVGAADILIARDRGADLVVVASIFQRSAAAFFALEDTPLDAPIDLLQLRVARNVDGLIDIELQAMLRAEGIDPAEIEPYPHEPGIAHVVEGRVDVMPGYRITTPFLFKKRGIGFKKMLPERYGVDFYGDSLFTHRHVVDGDSDAVERFIRATNRGWVFALEHPVEIADRIAAELPHREELSGGTFRELNRFQIDEVKALMHHPILEVGHINPHRWRRMNEFLQSAGIVNTDLVTDEFIFDPQKRKAEKEHRRYTMIKTILLALIPSMLLGAIFAWIWTLRRSIARKTAELRESRNKYRTLFEAANDAIFVALADTGNILDANRKAETLTGRSKAEIIGLHQTELHPNEQRESARCSFRDEADYRNGATYRYFDVLTRAGGRIPVEISQALLEIEGKQCVLGIFRDVSEQKKAEVTLRKHAGILSAVTEPVAYVNREYIYEIVNDARAERVGKKKEDFIGRHVAEMHGRDHFDRSLRGYMDRCFAGETVLFREWFSVPDGTKVFLDVSYYPVYDEKGTEVIGAAVYTRERTDQKKAEDALRESEARYRAIFRNQQVVMMVIDPDTGAIRDANPAAVDFYGWSYEELTGMNIKSINTLPPEEVDNEMRAARRKHGGFFQFRHRLKDGTIRDVEVSSGPVSYGEKMLLYSIVRDVTRRKRAEEALRESEEKYRILAENAEDVIFTLDMDLRYTYVSASVKCLRGYEPSELLGRSIEQTLLPASHAYAVEVFTEKLASANGRGPDNTSAKKVELEMNRKDGSTVWTEVNASLLYDDNGKPVGILGVTRDVTKRKKAEEALKESEARFRLIFEQSTAGIAIASADGGFIDANQAICDMLGYTREELLRLNVLDVTLPDDRDLSIRTDQPVLAGELDAYRLEKRYRHKDGRTVWADLSSSVIRDDHGNIRYAIGVVVDASERKRAEIALKASEEKFRKAFDTDIVAIAISRRRDGMYLEANPGFQKVTGYAHDEIIGRTSRELGFLSTQQRAELVVDLEEKGRLDNQELIYKTKNGEWKTLLFSIGSITLTNEDCFLATMVDITGRKKAEEAVENALAEKEVLLREIHHRVKNNMQVIISLLRMHERKNRDPHLSVIFDECRGRIEAMSLIHEALYQSDDLVRIDFRAYLRKLCRNLGQVHGAAGDGITVNADHGEVPLNMDQGIAVGMVIAELISNAFKHALPSNRAGDVTVGMTLCDAETVEVTVADDGKGLPPDFDISASPSLGMRLVWGAVTRELGGSIEATNEGGATFVIRFKYMKGRAKAMLTGEHHA